MKDERNPLLADSPYPYGAPQFDRIDNSHYLPAFEAALAEAREEIDAIAGNPDEPTFEKTNMIPVTRSRK